MLPTPEPTLPNDGAPPEPPDALRRGTVVDRYEVEACIGQGGMAQVYRVRHRTLRSSHALKVVRSSVPLGQERLLQEGRLQAQLRHPNLVAATDLLELGGGTVGLVLEYVGGPTLRAWMADDGDLRGATWLGVFRSIVRGVRCAHLAGVVHRDLKPANVLLHPTAGGWVPKITDFGIAKVLGAGDDSDITLGTPGFMAPEQVSDPGSVDERADLYSLGCLLHLMLAGTLPDRLWPAPMQTWPPRLASVVEQLLQPDPADRPANCQELLEALDAVKDPTLCDRSPLRTRRRADTTTWPDDPAAPPREL